MKIFSAIITALLVSSALSDPTTLTYDKNITIDIDFFPAELVVHTAEHEVISLTIPLNSLNFNENKGKIIDYRDSFIVFFVEGEPKPQGGYEYKGVFKLHKGITKLILGNGQAVAASNENSKHVYIGASDGIYLYDAEHDISTKYGTSNYSVVSIVKENGTDALYILTLDHFVYKVTGKKKTKLEGVKDAYEIVLDYSNNLYFLGGDNMPYVYTDPGVRHYEGLPANATNAKILKPQFVYNDAVPYISDNNTYIIFYDGKIISLDFKMKVKPSAYGMEGTIIEYFALNKKIYEYNSLALLMGPLLEKLKPFLKKHEELIKSIATRTRSELYQAQ